MVKMAPPHHEERVLDPACGSGGFLLHALDYIRAQASEFYEPDTPKHYTHWHDFAEKQLFGIEVNDSIARVAKMNMIIHDDGHSNVIGKDALINFDILYTQHRDFQKETFDLILHQSAFWCGGQKGRIALSRRLRTRQKEEFSKDRDPVSGAVFRFPQVGDRETRNHPARWNFEQFLVAVCPRLH